ncbi:MAG: hypothetical protein ACM30G_13365 [Micromonosporaceae bacterium]
MPNAETPTDQRVAGPAAVIRRVVFDLAAVLIVGGSLACGLFSPDGAYEPPPADRNVNTPAVPRPATTPGSAAVPG